MAYAQGRVNCNLLAVLCGKYADRERANVDGQLLYPFPELASSGRLEVHKLVNPTTDQFCEAQKLVQPNILYFQGAQLENEDRIGYLLWGTVNVSDPEVLSSLISPPLPTIVYFELPYGEKVAQAFRAKGVPYVIYWKAAFSYYAASHFRQALLSVVQSSCSHTWDAFQLAHASFRLYCARNNYHSKDSSQRFSAKTAPYLLGDAPKINIPLPDRDVVDEDNDSSESSSSITIFDDDVTIKFLICGVPCTLDACFLGSLEDGLNALLNIEIRGSKLRNRTSATPPPLQAENFSRGFVTMRCDITTCSYAHISLLVSGSAQTCFDDQLLECQIKHVLVEKSKLVHVLPCSDESKPYSFDSWNSASVACGTSVFPVCMKVPTWVAQVLKHLAPELSYHSLVTLGIASIQGTTVSSFEKEDAERLLFFCRRQDKDTTVEVDAIPHPPKLFSSLTRERPLPSPQSKPVENGMTRKGDQNIKMENSWKGDSPVSLSSRKKLKVAALRPIPHSMKHKLMSSLVLPPPDINNGIQVLPNLPVAPPIKYNVVASAPATHRKSTSSTVRSQPTVPLNPLPMKKHGCDRPPIQFCSEEEFLKDVMEFLILRGHSRHVPQGGISEFPDAVLNSKRLDLYNLYKEVVSRGGFYVGNGINWKGQVFSKMRNHTVTNRMTGVGNTLKRHYETYLLEYELAHDDVDGECCLLCRSSAPGDWVNCGLCGEWAHFGCDRRQGLGTFKDYAKTDGLEYICPHCTASNPKKKPQNMANGFPSPMNSSRHM